VSLAMRHGVAVGAHPGYPDREGFGRRDIEVSDAALLASIRSQLDSFTAVVSDLGGQSSHVKPHGALYNRAAADRHTADLLASIVADWDPRVVLVGLAGSLLLEAGRAAGLRVAAEAFADRAYDPDGSLRSRSLPGAVHEDPGVVAAQALAIARDGVVPLGPDGTLEVRAQTLCLHGDAPGAAATATAVRAALEQAGVGIRALGAES
jgi:UPF0271 protein